MPALQGFGFDSRYDLFPPAATDAAIVDRLAREVAAALADPGLGRRMQDAGLKPAALTGVIAAAGIKTE